MGDNGTLEYIECVCSKCGKVADDHYYEGHRWNKCICEICGKKAEENSDKHDWVEKKVYEEEHSERNGKWCETDKISITRWTEVKNERKRAICQTVTTHTKSTEAATEQIW